MGGQPSASEVSSARRTNEDVTSVATGDAKTVMDAMLSDSGVVVFADGVFWNQYLEKLNPTCDLDAESKWVTYITEDESVTACSTEVGGS